ncbi:hypothetical protein N9M41_03670 [Rhodopirellula sp.]|nr:hypothetical protein [Rhodopirellula sp.]
MPQSLQCPRCNGSVRVTDQAAGRRVKCPHCQQTFLAPGIDQSNQSQEDDWLSLEDNALSALPQPKTAKTQPTIPLPPDLDLLDHTDQASGGQRSVQESNPLESNTGKPDLHVAHTPDSSWEDDEEFVLKLPPNATLRTPAKTGDPNSLDSGFLQNEEALLQQFAGDEFDEFISDSEPVPSATRSNRAKGISGQPGTTGSSSSVGGVPESTSSSATNRKQSGTDSTQDARPIEYATEYRVNCKVCGSFIYAKATQAGKTIKCGDCYSEILIPSPPRIKKKPTMDMSQVETFQFESNPKAERRPDPFQKSADQLLAEAERADQEEPSRPTDFDTPQIGEWVLNVLAPFRDPTVLIHLAGLSILAIIPTLIVLKLNMPILTLGLFPGGLIVGLLTASCGMAILLAMANDESSVSEWPTLDPFGWLEQLMLVGGAAMLAAVPCWVLTTWLIGPGLLSAALTMFAIYLIFPFILLSMLDMNSVFTPFSSELARSVTKCEEAWGGFYFSSAILFVGTFLAFAVGSASSNETCAVISIIAAVTATFLYFGMIGRLAYAIGQSINAPPRKNDIEETRREKE